jgi:plasmid stabilization system protein ParE
MIFRFDEFALADVSAIVEYYISKERHQAVRFVADLYHQVQLFSLNPKLGYELHDDYRQFLLKQFPYTVIYEVNSAEEAIIVVAVCHQSRRPHYWRDRIQEEAASYSIAA